MTVIKRKPTSGSKSPSTGARPPTIPSNVKIRDAFQVMGAAYYLGVLDGSNVTRLKDIRPEIIERVLVRAVRKLRREK